MPDPGFREIHLSGKHVVFLFMAGAVAAVGIFLLGVSVGKGITKPETTTQAMAATGSLATDPGSSTTPDSKPAPGELQAFRTLQEKDAPKPSPSPAAATPAAKPADSPAPTLSPTPPPKNSPSPAPAVGSPYWVLVDSFASRTNANNRLAELKKKGFSTATVYTVSGSKVPYKVRLGPFPDMDAANAMKARLTKEGYKPSVTR